jgi:hypothetical protein
VKPDILFVFTFTVGAVDYFDVFPDNVMVSVDVCLDEA